MDDRINLAGAFFKRPDRTLEQCQRHYVENHGPLIVSTSDFSRDILSYTQHRRIDMPGLEPPDPDIAGVSQLLYRDLAAVRECFAGPGYNDHVRPDELRLADLSRSCVVIGPVETVIAGGDDAPLRLFRFVRAGAGGHRRGHAEAVAREMAGMLAGYRQTFSIGGEHNPFLDAPLFDGFDELRFENVGQAQDYLGEESRIGRAPDDRGAVITIAGEFRRFI